MARTLSRRVMTFCCSYRPLFIILEASLYCSIRGRKMISSINLQRVLTIGLLTYLYLAVLLIFQNSRFSTWQRYYDSMQDTLPDEDNLRNTSVVDYDTLVTVPVEYYYHKGELSDPLSELISSQKSDITTNRIQHDRTTMPTRKGPVYPYFTSSFVLNEYPVSNWIKGRECSCDRKFCGYDHTFAHLSHVLVDPALAVGRAGGEDMKEVMNQAESEEYLKLKFGYFLLNCSSAVYYKYGRKDHLREWITSTKSSTNITALSEYGVKYLDKFTIAVTRYEYVNMYHTMTDLYNVFLMLLIFKQNPHDVNVMWVDAHPKGDLDIIWSNLFGSTLRAKELQHKTLFRDLVWGITGYNSLLNNHDNPVVPYLEEFRDFFLNQHRVKDTKSLNCSSLSMLIIWRRGYVAHPRNPQGKVGRKIKNEKELENALQKSFPGHNVRGEQLDLLDMKEQLSIIAQTDVLMGMHGAGLTMTLFLPQHSAVVELYPRYWSTRNKHFRAMASWRKLHYRQWQNRDQRREYPDQFTYIPPQIVIEMVQDIVDKMCPNKKY